MCKESERIRELEKENYSLTKKVGDLEMWNAIHLKEIENLKAKGVE